MTTTAPTNSDYAQLKMASADLHFWYGQRKELAEDLAKAQRGIENADECIASATARIREAIAALGITTTEAPA